MGIQEREIIELYREMKAERYGTPITSEGIALLTVARILKRAMEKCTIEISGAIEQSQPEYELKLTLHQARAIIDMEDIVENEGLCLINVDTQTAWNKMLRLAKTITGHKAEEDD